MEEDNYRVAFIIAAKYYRNYQSYLQYYVDNIQKYYKNSFTIIVDNNSKYIDDIKKKLENYKSLVILTNNTECKFEVGAYKVGIQYLIDENIINNYDYYVFTQDTFVLKKKYDFNELISKNVLACSIGTYDNSVWYGYMESEVSQHVLKKLNLQNSLDKLAFCWCCSIILHKSKVEEFLDITKDIVTVNRSQSESSERYLAAIIYHLNNFWNYDGIYNLYRIKYDFNSVDILNDDSMPECFVKRLQQKNEWTQDE